MPIYLGMLDSVIPSAPALHCCSSIYWRLFLKSLQQVQIFGQSLRRSLLLQYHTTTRKNLGPLDHFPLIDEAVVSSLKLGTCQDT